MADEPQEPTTSTPANWPAVVMIALVVLAISVITWKAMDKYTDSKDAVAVLSTVIVPLAGIGAAVFGIKQGADAKAETKQVKNEAQQLANSLEPAPAGGGGGAAADVPAEQVQRVKSRLRSLAQ